MIIDDHRAFSTPYEPGYVVTITVDIAKFESEGSVYSHTELKNSDGLTVQSSSLASFTVTDTSCIWIQGDELGVGFAMYELIDGVPNYVMYLKDFGPEGMAPLTVTAAPGLPGYSSRIQYSDGRIETIRTPVEYEIGTHVAVVRKKDGSVIVTLAE